MRKVQRPLKCRHEGKANGSSRYYLHIIIFSVIFGVYVYAGRTAAGPSVEANQRREYDTVSENGTNSTMM